MFLGVFFMFLWQILVLSFNLIIQSNLYFCEMNQLLILFLNLGGGEVFLIVLVILLLFGGKGVPNLARALGKGIREFKDATDGLQKDIQQSTGGITSTIQEHIQEVKKEVDNFSESTNK